MVDKFPYMREVCDLFDVSVIVDAEETTSVLKLVPVYSLGQRSELAAGLRGFTVTPHFRSVELLNAFCKKHILRFRAIAAEQERTSEYETPDATTWEI